MEYLAKQGLSFRGHRDDKVDYSASDTNRGNFIALLQLMAKGNMVLQKHLSLVSKNSRYTSKTIQNERIRIYACAIKEKLTSAQLKEQSFPFTVIADEVTDPHANQEILSVCIRFLDVSLPCEVHIRECFLGFLRLDRAFPNSLLGEVRRWQSLWHAKSEEGANLPHNLLLSFRFCDADAFPNIYHLLFIACTLPITSAEAERSFSLMRRLKTYARSTMSEERLSDLAVIAMHYKEKISTDYICHLFCRAHPRRLFQSALFADVCNDASS